MISVADMEARRPLGEDEAAWAARVRPATVALAILAMAALCALALALPATTVTTKYVPELFVLLDGAYRTALGQVPSRDFHTVLGPLAHYLPAAGILLSGRLGGAVPVGNALFVLLLAPAMAHVLASRLRATIALPLALFLVLILTVPLNLGETVTSLSLTRFYNRVGWAALATLLVMYLPPLTRQRRGTLLDALAAALLLLVMLYTKATYAVVAALFLAFMLLDVGQRRWAALGLATALAAAMAVELAWRSSAAYAADLLLALRVSGALRGTAGQIAEHILRNLADYVLFALVAGLALWRTRSFRDLVFFLFCAVSGFLLINQNLQPWGIISLYAGAAVAAERLARTEETVATGERWPVGLGAPLFILALVLPTVVHCIIALGMHVALAVARGGEEADLPNARGIRLVHLWTWGEHESATKYLSSVQEGAEALKSLDAQPRHVFVLDFTNPFSASLGLDPARGDTHWLLWDRTLDAHNFVPPEQLLGDVQIVMEPKPSEDDERPVDQPASARAIESLWQIYGPYIAANFDVVQETEHWTIHRRRES
ncbi:MAG: hypothetical protein M3158_00365 [Pseudomonadota bacterium]|nr:hypothetical protein [Pseudomonadota bacterium]